MSATRETAGRAKARRAAAARDCERPTMLQLRFDAFLPEAEA
jgi:hypothetical protein